MYLFITGSREATHHLHGAYLHATVLNFVRPDMTQIVHGGARGVDLMVANMFPWYGRLEVPANWNQFGKSAGGLRNEALVELAMTLRSLGHHITWLAFPLGLSVGTRGCIKLAKEASFEVHPFELLNLPTE